MARIMTIDDSVSMRKLVSATLVAAGHEVVEASNGTEALNLAKNGLIQLFISDVNMPIMDGLTFVRNVRAIGAYKFTPVLMLTTEMDPEKKRSAKEAGATGWLVKPFDPEQLLATVRKVLD